MLGKSACAILLPCFKKNHRHAVDQADSCRLSSARLNSISYRIVEWVRTGQHNETSQKATSSTLEKAFLIKLSEQKSASVKHVSAIRSNLPCCWRQTPATWYCPTWPRRWRCWDVDGRLRLRPRAAIWRVSLSIRRNIGAALWLVTYGYDGAERDEVGHDRDDVDDVHQRPEEGEVVGRRGEPQRDLGREPDNARRLDEEERLVERRDVVACHYLHQQADSRQQTSSSLRCCPLVSHNQTTQAVSTRKRGSSNAGMSSRGTSDAACTQPRPGPSLE